ncbi:putative dihydrolipoyllysine-residue succinyltransferase [Apostichopus japonicus]|uniref:Dihydrolipoamide acetyltransferase component of pyruvate dehydrogenase complex n=1 Tax=Stichopus japonicus TaxID=307972 RepID=A0A2G8JYW6_STIJA|nr:putative dihydrolipoyllysine-residue succinyltransferase [Apostichopus japonicus]
MPFRVIGDAVAEDDVIGEIETDKTSIAVTSPVSGVIVEFLVEDGSTVIAGQQLVKIEITGGAGPSKAATPPTAQPPAPPAAAAKEEVIAPPPTTPPPIPPVPAGPMTIHAAPEIPSRPAVPPTATVQRKAAPSTPPPSGPGGVPLKATGTRTEQRVKMSRMRQRIAQRLKDAQHVHAMLTTFNEIDMSTVMDMRKKFKDEFQKKHGVKMGFMSAFLKASAHALCEMPVVNAVIDDLEIVYRDYIDISVAVATPKGLVVPVLRNVEAMNFADIERGLGELVKSVYW